MNELEKKIEEAADNHHYFGINAPIGSRNRANFEQKKESFIAGAKSDAAKNYWQKGMYTEEEVKELFRKFVIENTNISLIVAGNWLNKNKKKEE